MTDAIDLHAALIDQSPNIADWAKTVRITAVSCTAAGGFVIAFDRALPDSWKWPSAPPPSTDNFQFTVWIVLLINGRWQGAGFVQMWQGRPMGDRSLPPLFAAVDGAPGWTRWWGDARRLWPALVDHAPDDGESIGILVTAGNGRLRKDVTSVAERSNVVLFPVRWTDDGNVVYLDDVPPVVTPPVDPPPTTNLDIRLAAIEAQLARLLTVRAPAYEGTVTVPYLGTGKVVLTPKGTP